jgi:hypothetical protein
VCVCVCVCVLPRARCKAKDGRRRHRPPCRKPLPSRVRGGRSVSVSVALPRHVFSKKTRPFHALAPLAWLANRASALTLLASAGKSSVSRMSSAPKYARDVPRRRGRSERCAAAAAAARAPPARHAQRRRRRSVRAAAEADRRHRLCRAEWLRARSERLRGAVPRDVALHPGRAECRRR